MDLVVSQEWPAMAQGHLSPQTYAAYDDLLKEVSNPAIGKSAGQAVSTAILGAAVRVGTARSERLALSSDATSDLNRTSSAARSACCCRSTGRSRSVSS